MEDIYPLATGTTDKGLVREKNEDHYFVEPIPGGWLLVVCDGMGGHLGGQMASEIAVNTLREAIEGCLKDGGESDIRQILWDALVKANGAIHRMGQSSADYHNMGTTAAVVLVLGTLAYVAHVGDSRVYMLRDGELSQITTDHSKVQEMIEHEIINEEQAKKHPDAHKLTKALGIKPEVDPEVMGEPIQIRKGDSFLLCSDGLTDVVEDDEIHELLFLPPDEAMDNMVLLAKERGAPDNITIAIYRNSPPKKPRRRRASGALFQRTVVRRVLQGAAVLVLLAAVAAVAFYLGRGDRTEEDVVAKKTFTNTSDISAQTEEEQTEPPVPPPGNKAEPPIPEEKKVLDWAAKKNKAQLPKGRADVKEQPPVTVATVPEVKTPVERKDVVEMKKEPAEVPVEASGIVSTDSECDPDKVIDPALKKRVQKFANHLDAARAALGKDRWDGGKALRELQSAQEALPMTTCQVLWDEVAKTASEKQKTLILGQVKKKKPKCKDAKRGLDDTRTYLKIESLPDAEKWVKLCYDAENARREVRTFGSSVKSLEAAVSTHTKEIAEATKKINKLDGQIATKKNELETAAKDTGAKTGAAAKLEKELEKPLEEAWTKLADALKERDALDEKVKKEEDEKDKAKLQEKLTKAQGEHAGAKKELEKLQADQKKADGEKKAAEAAQKKIRGKAKELEKQLKAAKTSKETAGKALTKAKEDLVLAKDSLGKAKRKLRKLNEEREKLEYKP